MATAAKEFGNYVLSVIRQTMINTTTFIIALFFFIGGWIAHQLWENWQGRYD